MKKLFLSILSFFLPMLAIAEPVEIDGICYDLIKKIKEASVTYKSGGYSGDIVIPSTVEYDGIEYTVTSISGFSSSNSLYSVVMPNTVKKIEESAFWSCEYLTSITMSNSLEFIGKNAFTYCYRIESVNISDLDAWYNINFEDATSNPLFYSNTFGNGENHFNLNGEEITDLVIPANRTTINKYTFYGSTGITSVSIPASIKSIGQDAFFCANLISVHISDLNAWCNINFESKDSNPLYRSSVFSYWNNREDNHLYLNGTEIKDLVIPKELTIVGDYAFAGCNGITSINIHNSVTNIGIGAFSYCMGLNTIDIPNSVTTIGKDAFSGCHGLKSINLPTRVTTIEEGTFENCTSLESVNIPNNITSIGKRSFLGCIGLTSISIPNSVTSIGNSAFSGCEKLSTIVIGNGMITIGTYYNDIYELTRGGYCFAGCPEILDVYCFADEVPNAQSNIFDGSFVEHATLHVPAASVIQYKAQVPWSQFKEVMALNDEEIPETPKCATPEISYENGRVKFTCETQDVEYISNVTLADEHSYYDDEIQLSQKYKISVYATKVGYDNSDVVTREIEIKGDGKAIIVGDVDGDGKVNVADHVKLSDIIMNK